MSEDTISLVYGPQSLSIRSLGAETSKFIYFGPVRLTIRIPARIKRINPSGGAPSSGVPTSIHWYPTVEKVVGCSASAPLGPSRAAAEGGAVGHRAQESYPPPPSEAKPAGQVAGLLPAALVVGHSGQPVYRPLMHAR